jgi:hypothetical protein
MKPHKFKKEPEDLLFGGPVFRCASCDAISLDLDITPYSDPVNWLTVSNDCDRAGKQMELFQRQEELVRKRELYFCW